MQARTGEAPPGTRTTRVAKSDEPGIPYIRYGIPAGLVGASLVALFFLGVDVAAGRPLATPAALGASLFTGAPLDLARDPRAVLVLGYTAVHGAVFVAMGCLAALGLTSIRRLPSGAALAGVLFVTLFAFCEVVFLGFGFVFRLPLGELDHGRVAAANLLAAAGMALLLARVVPSGVRSGAGSGAPGSGSPERPERRPGASRSL
jgi:hypothetical protein